MTEQTICFHYTPVGTCSVEVNGHVVWTGGITSDSESCVLNVDVVLLLSLSFQQGVET